MLGLQHFLLKSDELKTIHEGLQSGLKEQLVSGLSGSARTLVIATLYLENKRPQLIVTNNLFHAQKLYDDLVELVGEDEVFLYPVNELIASEIAVASPELKGQRIETLNYLTNQHKGIVIAPIAGLRRLLPNQQIWKDSQLSLMVGQEIEVEWLLQQFVKMGYERTAMVASPGEFSVRGGIIDIYPLTEESPIRVELFDTEIDSIRYFNIEDQRSEKKIDHITIGPANELILNPEDYARGVGKLKAGLADSLIKIKNSKVKELLTENITYDIERLTQGHYFEEMFKYVSLIYDQPASLLDYLPKNGVIIYDEMSRVQEMSERLDKEEAEWHTALLEQGEILSDIVLSHKLANLQQINTKQVIYLSLFLRHVPNTQPQNLINMNCRAMQSFHGQMDLLKGEIKRWQTGNYTVVFLAANQDRAKRLENVLDDYQIEAQIVDHQSELLPKKLQILAHPLNGGFELSMQKLAVITEEELFKKQTKRSKSNQKLSNAERIKNYSELKVGDYVVHVNHGIGKYLGIETLEIGGIHKDYLHIIYSGNDKLYVPVEQIDLVQKFVASEDKEPKVYKLGGNDWKKVKKKVESTVQDIADDLIKLYAERQASVGYAFSEDTEEQQAFEASFQYQETEDQLRAIAEIKEDMEKERPMDRLLCGDVGYGKTEVAIRAAFKAITDGKQVAILVPTTILAQQHYETIRERFQGYPIEIGLLNRFRSRKVQTETMKGLKAGTIDLVIGTHRILSKDVVFRDLGLLIVDEEQRFGVTHKEKIKKMKANVDVLTLTATPIPRTLHMSMLGVRDLSVIETPPENRFPIQTYVVEYNGALVREAIERELARGGQTYFLYNRVEDIERKASEIAALVPDARVTFAHGRMNETELESAMLDFLEGEYDVLVSTTIIETGVDIPNVNTLIVSDADRMGLSQLYQLRGRVGRSNRVAYAYFTYKKDKVLKEVAEKRLQAIKEFTELGSGFKIAMRDLTIRGAGNLLGAQQHGFIDSVGFDLYSQMLKEAIEQRQGSKKQEKREQVEIDLKIDAYIPEAYINDAKQKIDMYKRFRGIETMEEISELQEEMIDRFGDYPEEVAYLFDVSKIKIWASLVSTEKIVKHQDEIEVVISEEGSKAIESAKLVKLVHPYGRKIRLGSSGKKLKIVIVTTGMETKEWLELFINIFEKINEATKELVSL